MTISKKLEAVVAKHSQRGSSRANLGRVTPSAGYEVMRNLEGDRFYWVCFDGREGKMCWDKWTAFGAAASDAYTRRGQGTG